MKRILITGSNGLLGQKLVELFSNSDCYSLLLISRQEHSVFQEETLQYRQLDTTNKQGIRKIIEEFEPDIIINTAAMTNVDQCETEREAAWKINVNSVEHLVHMAKLVGAHIVHISTDYVFDGKQGPYDELAVPNPINYYGRTKHASENVLRISGIPFTIVRTMILYGTGYNVKTNFGLWLYQNLSEGKVVSVSDDQRGNPTLADDVAYGILKIIELERSGIYHIAGQDLVSRYDFTLELAHVFGFNKKLITPVKTTALKQAAPRPLNSGFITLKAQAQLSLHTSGIVHGLMIFKNQLMARKHDLAVSER
ncbi:MAG: dTDP-4-dehydrorhamnose reductase [Ignavibacteriae bacterium]|nr:dTDP-4-dehydrorhamnose reductase [Ignavibacteriota bacterium]